MARPGSDQGGREVREGGEGGKEGGKEGGREREGGREGGGGGGGSGHGDTDRATANWSLPS